MISSLYLYLHSNGGLLIYMRKHYEILDKQRAVIEGQARGFPCMSHILNPPNFKAINRVNFQKLLFFSPT